MNKSKNTLLLLFLLIFTNCKTDKKEEKDSYFFIDGMEETNCKMYGMIFTKGDYVLSYNCTGSCNDLDSEKYIYEYEKFIHENLKLFKINNGKILLQYYNSFDIDSNNINKIIAITRIQFKNYNVDLLKFDKEKTVLNINNLR